MKLSPSDPVTGTDFNICRRLPDLRYVDIQESDILLRTIDIATPGISIGFLRWLGDRNLNPPRSIYKIDPMYLFWLYMVQLGYQILGQYSRTFNPLIGAFLRKKNVKGVAEGARAYSAEPKPVLATSYDYLPSKGLTSLPYPNCFTSILKGSQGSSSSKRCQMFQL